MLKIKTEISLRLIIVKHLNHILIKQNIINRSLPSVNYSIE